jgi:hypothetical protein
MNSPTSDDSSPDTAITSCERNEKDDECENNDGDIADDEHDISEIIRELQVALEYLISDERRQSYSSINNEATSTTTTEQHHVKSGVDAEDETLCVIPNLVNRVLTEHYSPRLSSQTYKRRDISYSTCEKMTQLMIAVIVEFAEPYFVRITKRRDEERKMQLHNKEQISQMERTKKRAGKKRKVAEDENKMQSSSEKVGFEDRAVSWATNCLKVLLQPSLSASKNSGDNKEEEKNALDDDLHIPELDAFLAATGANDGNEMEKRMQQALLLGMHARSMFVSSYIAECHPNKNF